MLAVLVCFAFMLSVFFREEDRFVAEFDRMLILFCPIFAMCKKGSPDVVKSDPTI